MRTECSQSNLRYLIEMSKLLAAGFSAKAVIHGRRMLSRLADRPPSPGCLGFGSCHLHPGAEGSPADRAWPAKWRRRSRSAVRIPTPPAPFLQIRAPDPACDDP